MASTTMNIAKGRVNELVRRVVGNDPADSGITVVLLKVAQALATLQDYDTLSALLGDAGNTECDFTNYARKDLTDADLSNPTVDDTGNTQNAIIGDQVYTSAGGATNNNIVVAVICYNPAVTADVDANIIPLTAHDFVVTTNGGNITLDEPAAGFFEAA